jgi:mono/diheme cytochrome c family protein
MSPGNQGKRQKAEGRSGFLLLAVAAFWLISSACHQKMANQAKYDPLEPSDFFADGMSARPRIAGTVARGEATLDSYSETGKIGDQDGDGFPFAVTADVMNQGHERFDIYCSECHGRLGDGNGMIPSRGYRHPPTFHTQTLRAAKTGHFFDVMTNGFGAMPPYRTMIPSQDRWAIIAYIRALQTSQSATIDDVPAEARGQLNENGGLKPASTQNPHGGAR